MTENKLYAQCREEARKIIYDNIGVSNIKYDLAQLTAEIYGMKLLEMSQPLNVGGYEKRYGSWYSREMDSIGTTQQLHDHFVREFNVSLTNEGNNSKQ